MTTHDQPWRGPEPVATQGSQPDLYTVKFHAPAPPSETEEGQSRLPGARGITIFVQAEAGGELRVLGFVGTGQPFSGLGLEYLTRRAVDVVRALVMSN